MGVGSFGDIANYLGFADALDYVPIGFVADGLDTFGHRGDDGLVDVLSLLWGQNEALGLCLLPHAMAEAVQGPDRGGAVEFLRGLVRDPSIKGEVEDWLACGGFLDELEGGGLACAR